MKPGHLEQDERIGGNGPGHVTFAPRRSRCKVIRSSAFASRTRRPLPLARSRAFARSHTRSDSERPTGTAPTPRWLKALRMRYSSESVAGGSGTAGLTTSPTSLLDADRKLSGGIRLPTFAPALRRRAQVPFTERVSRNHRGRVEGRGGNETKSVMSGTECGRVIR
jgi:hypothetical protein